MTTAQAAVRKNSHPTAALRKVSPATTRRIFCAKPALSHRRTANDFGGFSFQPKQCLPHFSFGILVSPAPLPCIFM